MSDDWKIVQAAIDEDRAMRYPGVHDGLYSLIDMKPFRRFGAGVPMLRCMARGYHIPFSGRCATDAQFRDYFERCYPMLTGFDLKKHGLYMAGSVVCTLLTAGVEYTLSGPCGVDLYPVGHASDIEVKTAIEKLHAHLMRFYNPGTSQHLVFRTRWSIMFWDDGSTDHIPIQVILRRYSTLAKVLHGFDISSSAFLWDGERIWMSALGRLVLNHGAIVPNLPIRRASLENRIAKQFGEGFDIILPELAVCSRSQQHYLRLPYLTVRLSTLGIANDNDMNAATCAYECSCSVTIENITSTRPGCDWLGRRMRIEKDKDAGLDDAVVNDTGFEPDTLDCRRKSCNNLRYITTSNARILGGKYAGSLCCYATDRPNLDIFSVQPTLDEEKFIAAAEEAVGIEPMDRDAEIYYGSCILVNTLHGLFGADIAPLIVRYLTIGQRPSRADIAQLVQARIDMLNSKQVQIPFEIISDAETAPAGPFPCQVVTPYKWYGPAAWGPARDWRIMGSGAALCLAASGLTAYPIMWILQWTYPSVLALNERWLVKTIEIFFQHTPGRTPQLVVQLE